MKAALRAAGDLSLAAEYVLEDIGIADLLLYVTIGEVGVAKASFILHSGVESELLAVQVSKVEPSAPTRTVHISLCSALYSSRLAGSFSTMGATGPTS
jgi:hypothetical protein